MVNFNDIEDILSGLKEDLDDPEAQYELERMEDHYHNALRAEYLEKEDGEYDL